METVLRTELSDNEREYYLDRLEPIHSFVIAQAFDTLIDTWKPQYGRTFPAIAEILEVVESISENPRLKETGAELRNRGDKPPGWIENDQERQAHASELLSEMRSKIAAGAFEMPSYSENAEKLARLRLGPSAAPKDPAERRKWAHELAIKQGMIPPD